MTDKNDRDDKTVDEPVKTAPVVEPAPVDEPVVMPGAPSARVADSYGYNPHEHKPSQDAWSADDAEYKQAESGGVVLSDKERERLDKLAADADKARADDTKADDDTVVDADAGTEESSPGNSSSTLRSSRRSSVEKNRN